MAWQRPRTSTPRNGWAEITPTRFGFHIIAGNGPSLRQGGWWRHSRKAAERKARRIIASIDRGNAEQARSYRVEPRSHF